MISIHAPHTGCDRIGSYGTSSLSVFQSTHPTRGATRKLREYGAVFIFQSTHPTRGATKANKIIYFSPTISIHAPHTGCDTLCRRIRGGACSFQSTHPTRGATNGDYHADVYELNFNPRTPHGVRRYALYLDGVKKLFQSTHPTRGATQI